MLALSPPSFSTNIAYWPLEDPIGHDNQNYFYSNKEAANSDQPIFLNFPNPPETDQQPQGKLDHRSTTPLTTEDFSSDLSMAVKKIKHNASERDRRKKINHLYSSLRSQLPASNLMKKLSIPATVSYILKYIPELQQEIEELVRKREELLSKSNPRHQGNIQVHQKINDMTKSQSRTSFSSVSTSQLNDEEAVVQISTLKFDKNPLSKMLHDLEEDGLSVLSASSFESFGGRIFHILHLQVEGSNNVEFGALDGKLFSLYDDKELLI